MTSKRNKERAAKAALRKYKKRPNLLNAEKVVYVDYKDVNLLQRFMSDRSKLKARRMNGNDVQQQRDVATAVKNAREMALLPYTKRVASTRAPRRDDDGRRGPRDEATPTMSVEGDSSELIDQATDVAEVAGNDEITEVAETATEDSDGGKA
jgi:small subunit ribosomal protein S18